jgi:hypothetical protein
MATESTEEHGKTLTPVKPIPLTPSPTGSTLKGIKGLGGGDKTGQLLDFIFPYPCLLPLKGIVKGYSPFSLREKAGMRGDKNQAVILFNHLTLTHSRRETVLLRHPYEGRWDAVLDN